MGFITKNITLAFLIGSFYGGYHFGAKPGYKYEVIREKQGYYLIDKSLGQRKIIKDFELGTEKERLKCLL